MVSSINSKFLKALPKSCRIKKGCKFSSAEGSSTQFEKEFDENGKDGLLAGGTKKIQTTQVFLIVWHTLFYAVLMLRLSSNNAYKHYRLNPRHRTIAEKGIPPLNYEYENEKWAIGERFGQYGLSANVDIRKLWPSVEVSLFFSGEQNMLINLITISKWKKRSL